METCKYFTDPGQQFIWDLLLSRIDANFVFTNSLFKVQRAQKRTMFILKLCWKGISVLSVWVTTARVSGQGNDCSSYVIIRLERMMPLVTTPQVVLPDKLRCFHKPENISQNAVKEFLQSCQMANPIGKWIEFIPAIIFLSVVVLFLRVGKRNFRQQKPNNVTRRQKTYFRRLCIQYS